MWLSVSLVFDLNAFFCLFSGAAFLAKFLVLLHVRLEVALQVSSLGEAVFTTFNRALKWFFLGVRSNVIKELVEVVDHLAAGFVSFFQLVSTLKQSVVLLLFVLTSEVVEQVVRRRWYHVLEAEPGWVEVLAVDDGYCVCTVYTVLFYELVRKDISHLGNCNGGNHFLV